jgi:hypothetical protein
MKWLRWLKSVFPSCDVQPIIARVGRVPDCSTCDRDGHGRYYVQCEDMLPLGARGVCCWRPVGCLLVWDHKKA